MKNLLKDWLDRLFNIVKEISAQTRELLKSPANRKGMILLLVGGLAAGWILSSVFQGPRDTRLTPKPLVHGPAVAALVWTCSMHPQIQLPKPGKCPICGMDLIPMKTEAGEGMPSARRLVMSPDAMKLAEIETSPVEKKLVSVEVPMVGKVEYDETRIAYITAWTGGRIDRLYIDQTGIPIRKGDHMAYLYSPELLSAQEEYLQALESVEEVKETHLDIIRSTSEDTVKNAREKLKLLGVTDEQIAELEKQKAPKEHMTIYAPASGIVVGREVEEGDYVKTGTRIYSIVDLSYVWVKLDAYESDLQWLRYGQKVEFEAEAYPGDIFRGRISFIDPVLNETTRTVKVRVNVDNRKEKLKPGMFVRGLVRAQVAGAGRVVDSYLAGKWIGPMHPEIIRDEPGVCPICGMPLVQAEEMGYTTVNHIKPPLVIPVSAVLKTGKRAVVYVRSPDTQKPTFEGREIVLGPRAGNYYIVKAGLTEGERVVTHGNFKIDSALQIQAKPSMMNPEGGVGGGHDMSKMGKATSKTDDASSKKIMMEHEMAPQAFFEQLSGVYGSYFELQQTLGQDDLAGAKSALRAMEEKLDSVDMNLLQGKLHGEWMNLNERLQNSIVLGIDAKTLRNLREESFKDIASQMLSVERKFGHAKAVTYYEAFCPMALNNKGASWLQMESSILNPFLGKNMPTCGEIKKEYTARTGMDSSLMKSGKQKST